MGAFLLYKEAEKERINNSYNYFSERGFSEPMIFTLGNWILWLYKKILVKHRNYLFIGQSAIFVNGSLVYKGKNYEESIKKLLEDRLSGEFDIKYLYGSYTIIFYIDEQLSILRDPSNISNVYFSTDKSFVTSSFIAACTIHKGKLKIDKGVVMENLVTGFIIGPDTVFKQVKRVDRNHHLQIDNITFLYPDIGSRVKQYKSINEAIDTQLANLDAFFMATKKLASQYGVDCGLTGGFDSRLLLIMALRHYGQVNIYSYWRKEYNNELECAKLVGKRANLELKIVPATNPMDMSEDQLSGTIAKAFIYYDGHIRMHSFWHEEYNTFNYRNKVAENIGVGLYGIGGEQYRNGERILFKRKFKQWVRHELIYKSGGDCFVNRKEEKYFSEWYGQKIRDAIKAYSKKINHYTIKRYYNEIQNPFFRAVRTNIENSDMFFFNPFADTNIAIGAYDIIPFLGLSTQFQQEMIKRLNPEVASVISAYGYDFFHGEPLTSKYLTIIKEIIPSYLFYRLYIKKKASHNNTGYNEFESKFPSIKALGEIIADLGLPLNFDVLKTKSDLYPLIWSMGYLISRFQDRLQE